jgi:hypothetical protein
MATPSVLAAPRLRSALTRVARGKRDQADLGAVEGRVADRLGYGIAQGADEQARPPGDDEGDAVAALASEVGRADVAHIADGVDRLVDAPHGVLRDAWPGVEHAVHRRQAHARRLCDVVDRRP